MNKRQRQELCEHVESEANVKIRMIQDKVPDKPSLNYYIISAIMEGSIQMQTMEELLKYLQDKVKKLGHNKELIRRDFYREDGDYITFDPERIFVIPAKYTEELKIYEEQREKADREIEEIKRNLKIIKLKIMVGSNEALSPLLYEIDNVGGTLSILGDGSSNKLLLTDGATAKE